MKRFLLVLLSVCLLAATCFAAQQTWTNTSKAKDVLAVDGPIDDNFDDLYAITLAISGANGSLISANDTTPGFLNGKLVAGTDISLTEGNDGGDETLTVALDFSDAEVKTAYENNADTNAFTDAASATITNAVEKTGNQTIGGVKTFTAFSVTPSSLPTTNYQTANKRYVDETVAGDAQSLIDAAILAAIPVGTIHTTITESVPTGYLECDGSIASMTTYSALFAALDDRFGLNSGATFTSAFATDTITVAAHGMSNNDIIRLSTSGGDLPDGLLIETDYYIIDSATDSFKVSLTSGGAAIDILDDGTGTHKEHNEFLRPDMRGKFLRGWDHGAGVDPDAASRTDSGDGTTGDHTGTNQACANEEHLHTGNADSAGSHAHTITRNTSIGGSFTDQVMVPTATGVHSNISSSVAGAHAHTLTIANQGGSEARPINITVMYCIKY